MADDTQTTDTDTQTTTTETAAATVKPDPAAWITSLPEDQQALAKAWHDAETAGQQSALVKERQIAKDKDHEAAEANKKLRELAKTADADTAAKLEKLANEKDAELESARRESTFYREAATAGVPADKLARAWLLCKNADYFNKRGDPDIAAMKAEIPELFAAPVTTTRVNAGTGTGQQAAVAEQDPLRAAIAAKQGRINL